MLRRALSEAREDDVTTMAQALAYSLFLAIPAVALVVLGVFSLLANPSTIQDLVGRAHPIMPAEAVVLLQGSLERSSQSTSSGLLMTVLGLALALWTTTSAATTLMQGLTRAYDVKDERGFVRKRLRRTPHRPRARGERRARRRAVDPRPHLERWLGSALGPRAHGVDVVDRPVAAPLRRALVRVRGILFFGPDVEDRNWKATPRRRPGGRRRVARRVGRLRRLRGELRLLQQELGDALRGRGHARLAVADERRAFSSAPR